MLLMVVGSFVVIKGLLGLRATLAASSSLFHHSLKEKVFELRVCLGRGVDEYHHRLKLTLLAWKINNCTKCLHNVLRDKVVITSRLLLPILTLIVGDRIGTGIEH